MAANHNAINQTFLPIVTTYTISSEQTPLETIVSNSQLLAQAFYDYQQKVGYNCLPIMGDSTYVAEAFGCQVGYGQREPFVRQTHTFADPAEVAQLDIPEIGNCARIQAMLQAVSTLSRQATKQIPVIVNSPGPLTSTGRILGMDNLMLNMALNPAMVKSLLEKVTRFLITYTEALVDCGADIFFLPDPMASTDLISPAMFNEFALPMLKRQVSSVDRPVLLHICGKIMPIVKDMADTGAALISIDQNINVEEIRAAIGQKPLIGGNLDPIEILEKKTAAEVAAAARRCCRQGGEDFILMPGCTITPQTPSENIKALIEVAKEELRAK